MSDLEIPGAGGGGSANVSDAAYDATAWDGDTDAPSKNAIRDKIETLTGGHDPVTVTDTTEVDLTLTGQALSAVLKAGSIAKARLVTAVQTSLGLADTATQPGDLATVATSGDYDDLSNKPDLSAFDNISEHANVGAFPGTGAADKFYLAQDTGILYRWTGSAYAIISAQLALGETSSTAYRGDRGATAFAHVSATDNPHSVSKAQVGLSDVPNVDARARSTHTGTQLASTISNFATTVRATVLTGLSTATSTAVVAADTILVAIGKLQAQVNLKANKANVLELDNTTSFTPDADYEPATKKYVDDNGGGGASVTISDTAPASPSTGDLWADTSEEIAIANSVLFSMNHTQILSGVSDSEIYRGVLAAGEQLIISQIQAYVRGGGTEDSDFTITLYDETNSAAITATNLNDTNDTAVTTTAAITFSIKVDNSTGSDVDMCYTIKGYSKNVIS